MKKILAKSVYEAFNFFNGKALSKHINMLKERHNENGRFKQDRLHAFLVKWGLNINLQENPIQTKAEIKAWTAKIDPKKIASWAYTGGSYGEPLRVPYSQNRNYVRTATFKYFNELAGYHLGDPFVLIRAKNKAAWEKFLRNEHIFIPQDTSAENLKKFAIYLKQHKVEVLMGYPTVMFALAIFLDENPQYKEGLKIKSMISVSEPLESEKRAFIHKVMQCRFVDRYSNEEVGLICQQQEFGGEYLCNQYGIITEVVDPITNIPVNRGEKGKVLVTDLHNDLIPVVRYDTGDLAVAGESRDGFLVSIQSIEGRVTEQIFSASGKPISPLILGPYIYKPLSRQDKVFQYQFAQIGEKEYELRIKATQEELSDDLINELETGLVPVLGAEANLHINPVEDIKPQPSGKRPVFKNEF
jgi:phenylacetate-CoA ligase